MSTTNSSSSVGNPAVPENIGKRTLPIKKYAALTAGAIIVIALTAYGVQWWTVGRFLESTDDAYVRTDVVTVSARVPGYVMRVNVADDQRVRKGEVLARLDDADYRANVAKAQALMDTAVASLHEAQAALATLGAQLDQQTAVIDAALASVTAADATRTQRLADAQRYRQLAAEHATSAQRWEQAHANALSADAALAKARAEVGVARGEQWVLVRQKAQHAVAIERAQTQLALARATLTLAQNALDYTVIRAATDGVIGQRAVRVGHYIESGQPLMAVVPLDTAYVIANFKETDVANIHPGQGVDIDVDAYSGRSVHGTVIGIAPGSGAEFALLPPDNATGNFTKVVQRIPVKIAIDKETLNTLPLRPGMSVIAHVHTREAGDRSHTANSADSLNSANSANSAKSAKPA